MSACYVYLNPIVILILSLIFSGCATTRYVREIGFVYESLDITTIYNADRIVILEAAVTKGKYSSRSSDTSYKKFIVGSPDLVSKSVDTFYAELHAKVTKRQITPVFITITANREKGWQLLPNLIPKDVSSEIIVSRLFEQNGKVDKTEPIRVYSVTKEVPFNIDGVKYSLTFIPRVLFRLQGGAYYTPSSGVGSQTEISWWHYPLQVLLIPAAVIDIVTFPIQFYLVTRNTQAGP